MRLPISLILALVASLASGCAARPPAPIEPAPAGSAGLEARLRELEAENSRQALLLLERRIRLGKLERRLETSERLLDRAIDDVVRARADRPSPDARAAAATAIADLASTVRRKDEAHTHELLRRARTEFDAGNFDGAFYLATMATSDRRASDDRAEQAVAGETPFEAPLPLAVTERCEFRDGPGTEFRVLKRIEAGTVMTGYATKGSWVRGTVPDGTSGWVHRSLVEGDAGS